MTPARLRRIVAELERTPLAGGWSEYMVLLLVEVVKELERLRLAEMERLRAEKVAGRTIGG